MRRPRRLRMPAASTGGITARTGTNTKLQAGVMHRITLYVAIALLAGGACRDSTGPELVTVLDCDRAVRYKVGTTLSGRLAVDDCQETLHGFGTADYYAVRLDSAGPLTIEARASDGTDLRTLLLVPTGEVLRTGGGSPAYLGGDIPAGDYVLVVSSALPEHLPRYQLSSSREMPPVFGCTSVSPLALPFNGFNGISPTDCFDAERRANADYYAIRLASNATLQLDVIPSGNDTLITGVISDAGNVLVVDTVSRAGETRILAALPAGRYTIFIAGLRRSHHAVYVFAAELMSAPPVVAPPTTPDAGRKAHDHRRSLQPSAASAATPPSAPPADRSS